MLTEHEVRRGLRVKLTNPRKRGYIIGKSNPAVGTDWECGGKITDIKSRHKEIVEVRWDNGSKNSYHLCTLSKEVEGGMVDIWHTAN
jgi:hypothetical protein